MYPPPRDEGEGSIDIFEALDTQLGLRGISTEGFVAEDFEEVDKYDLGKPVNESLVSTGRGSGIHRLTGL